MDHFEHIKWDVRDNVGMLTISNKPENYLEYPDFVDPEQLVRWTSDNSLRGLVVHGDGRHFSAGGNLSNISKLIQQKRLKETIEKGKAILNHIEQLSIPVVAAIRGVCFGGGLEVALACHIRICSENALFALPESNHSLIPGLGGTVRLPRLVTKREAIEIVMSGDLIDAEKALKTGLIDHICQSDDIAGQAVSFIKKMTDNRPVPVIHAVVESIRNAGTLSPEEAMKRETELFCKLALEKDI